MLHPWGSSQATKRGNEVDKIFVFRLDSSCNLCCRALLRLDAWNFWFTSSSFWHLCLYSTSETGRSLGGFSKAQEKVVSLAAARARTYIETTQALYFWTSGLWKYVYINKIHTKNRWGVTQWAYPQCRLKIYITNHPGFGPGGSRTKKDPDWLKRPWKSLRIMFKRIVYIV